jgi:hypothetical protein
MNNRISHARSSGALLFLCFSFFNERHNAQGEWYSAYFIYFIDKGAWYKPYFIDKGEWYKPETEKIVYYSHALRFASPPVHR